MQRRVIREREREEITRLETNHGEKKIHLWVTKKIGHVLQISEDLDSYYTRYFKFIS